MKEKMNKLMILIYILLLFGCKSHSVCNEMPLADKVTQKSRKTTKIDFNHFKVINSDEYRNSFSDKKYKFTYNDSSETFNLFANNKKIGVISLKSKKYDGPGFNIYQYSSSQPCPYIIFIIEATADIGTEWYKVIIIKNEKIISDFFIHEPRSDSDRYLLNHFMSISFEKNTFTFKLKKSLMASYSLIPKEFKQDKDYIYIEKRIKETK